MDRDLETLKDKGSYPRPLFLIAQLHDEMRRRLGKHMHTMDLTWALGRVFNAIATRPQISSAQLAKMFGITPQSVKQSVTELEKRGLVERIPSETDQRVRATVLTPRGRALRKEHSEALEQMYREIFGSVNEGDVAVLTRVLIKALASARPEALDYFAASAVTQAEQADEIGDAPDF